MKKVFSEFNPATAEARAIFEFLDTVLWELETNCQDGISDRKRVLGRAEWVLFDVLTRENFAKMDGLTFLDKKV